MVDVERNLKDVQYRFILRPNRSLSWQGSLLFFYSLCLISLIVAVSLTWLGFWLVLPFAGLEMLALGCGLYVVSQRCHQCEVISITADSIRIEKGRSRLEQQWLLERFWARVVLEHCPRHWYPSRLLIRSQGRAVEIGKFLNEDERLSLARALHRSL